MKVALDVGPLKPRPAGVGIYVRSLANALAELPDTELTLLGRRPDAEGLANASAVVGRWSRLPYSVWNQLVAPKQVAWAKPDVTHFTDGIVPLVRRWPTVLTVLDLSLARHWRSHRLVRYARIPLVLAAPRLAARVLVPSRATADEVIALTQTPAKRIDIVPLAPRPKTGLPADVAEVLGRHGLSARGYLLALGTIEPRKNHVRVIHAFERLVATNKLPGDMVLAIVGQPGWRAQAVLDAISESHSASRIRLLGYVPDADISALLAATATAIYVSLYEGFGLPIVEAMAQGAAVVTSNTSSMPEAAGDAAIQVDPYDVEAIARGIDEAVRGADAMRAGALAQAARFSWSRTAEGTRESYAAAIGQG
jgi:glycosyltransferase involved in cell wall biosynthesis